MVGAGVVCCCWPPGRVPSRQKYEDFKADRPLRSLDTLLVNVRIGRDGAKARMNQFEIVTSQQRNHEFRVSYRRAMIANYRPRARRT